MKKMLHQRAISLVLFALLWMFILPFTAKSQDCEINTFPFTENFTSYATGGSAPFPKCWSRLSPNASYPNVNAAGNGNANSMNFFISGATNVYNMLVCPISSVDISLLRVSFDFAAEGVATFEIGVMTNPLDTGTFQVVEDYKYTPGTAISSAPYVNHTIYFDEYEGNGKYIAFKLSKRIGDWAYARLDNIVIDQIPTCTEIQNLTISNVAGRTALVTWQPSVDKTSEYEIEVLDDDENSVFFKLTEELTYTITDLNPNTNYVVRVRALCDYSESPWVSKNIKTEMRPECTNPNFFSITEITSNSAYVSWVEDGTSSQYLLEYSETSAITWHQEIIYANNKFAEYSFANLNPNTEYIVRMRVLCNDGDFTAWTVHRFHTSCTPATLPFMETFDNIQGGTSTNGLVPTCWNINVSNTVNKPYVVAQSSLTSDDFVSAYGALNFHYAPNTTNIAILPPFNLSTQELTISNLQVNFMAKASNVSAGVFVLGVMDIPTDATTFVPVDTIRSFTDNDVWTEFTISLDSYKGTGNYIAFMWKNAGNNTVLMDNIYVDVITECPKSDSFTIDNITQNTVSFSWVADNAGAWEAVCALQGTRPDWNYATSFNGNTGSVTGLTHTTQYDLYFRTVCGDYSVPHLLSFKTACDLLTETDLPYVERFDTYGTGTDIFPTCWHRTNATATYVGATHSSAPGAIVCNYTAPSVFMVTSPELALDISTLQVDFKLMMPNRNVGIIVGAVTDPAISGSFIPMDTIYCTTANVWENHTVYFNRDNALGKYIAFWIGGFGSAYTLYIDDIIIDKIGTCITPNGVKLANVSDKDATILWNENGTATEWEIAYGRSGFNPNNGEGELVVVNMTSTTLTSLTNNTLYDVYVRANCNGDDNSSWSHVVLSFYTMRPIATLPYKTDFEDDFENLEWTLINDGQINQWNFGTAANNTVDGSKSLYISNTNGATYGYNNTSTSYVYALRTVDFAEAGTYEFAFDIRSYGEVNFDVMRVFLVPSSVRPVAGVPNGMADHNNPTPSGWIDIGNGPIYYNSAWTRKKIELTIADPSAYHLVFFWKNNGLGGPVQYPGAVDNITIERYSCAEPINFTLLSRNETEAALLWNEKDTTTTWEIQYGAKGFTAGEGTPVFVNTLGHTLTKLSPNFTSYDVYVRSVCEVDNVSRWVGPINFRTTQQPAPLPYTCDFENTTENGNWGLINGSQPNKWAIGAAENNGGQQSMYISNTDGATNEYTIGATSYVYAMRSLNFNEQGVYEIEFDWKANGYSSNDLLRAFLVPESEMINDGDGYVMAATGNGTPARWIDVGTGNLNNQTIWQHAYSKVTITNTGIYNLVFFWKNYSNTEGNQAPGVIDNISVQTQSCPTPYAVTVTNVMTTTATIAWTEFGTATNWEVQYGPAGFTLGTEPVEAVTSMANWNITTRLAANSSYDVYVRSVCNGDVVSDWSSKITFTTLCEQKIIQIPYLENFDNYDNGIPIPTSNRSVLPNCWIVRKSNGVSNPYIANLGTGYRLSEPYALNFVPSPDGYSMVVLPELDGSVNINDLQLSFWGRSGLGGAGTFTVGIMDNPYSDESFVTIASYSNPNAAPLRRIVSFETYNITGKYIAFKWANATGNNNFILDEIELVTRTIAEVCTPPTSLIASDITENSATVTWAVGGSETSWSVEYKKVSESNYSTPTTAITAIHNLTNLTANTAYDVRIIAICNDSISTAVTTQFTTLPPSIITFTITPSAGENGTINPAEQVIVNQGASQTFTFTANQGFLVDSIWVNDVLVGVDSTTYTIQDVQANMTIHVTFVEDLAVPQHYLDNSVFSSQSM